MTDATISQTNAHRGTFDRRTLLATATAAGITVVAPQSVRGTTANSKLAIALVGCGGRGRWIANLFMKDGGYQLVATADYFQDRADAAGDQFKVASQRRYPGLAGYKRLLAEAKPDAIVVESPPYFHPEHATAGVEAGCHVYVAKPIAVDVPGCNTIAEAGRKATEKNLAFLVDFQSRANEFYREAVRRVHAGAIGPLASGEAVYYTSVPWREEVVKLDMTRPENRIRAWGLDKVLSGDIITEQNIHALDVATWIVDDHPVKAVGTCGKKGRVDNGTCNDHFAVIFTFPNDLAVSFASKQYGTGHEDIGCRMFGPKGTIDTHYGGIVVIRGLGGGSYKGGNTATIYADGAIRNIADFRANILKRDFSNTTVAPSVRSNLTTILGRTAAYKRAEVTWDEVLKANEKLEFDTKGLKA